MVLNFVLFKNFNFFIIFKELSNSLLIEYIFLFRKDAALRVFTKNLSAGPLVKSLVGLTGHYRPKE